MRLLLQTTPDYNKITTQNIILSKDGLKWVKNEIFDILEIEKGDPLKLKINYFENGYPISDSITLDKVDFNKYQFINIGYFNGEKNKVNIELTTF